MQIERNELRQHVNRPLLCVTHSDRPLHEPSCDINYLEMRYAAPDRLPPMASFQSLRPASEYSPYHGAVTLYHLGDAAAAAPQLVCAFRPPSFKPQHALWHEGHVWVLGTEQVAVYDADLRLIATVEDPWLAGGHTLAAAADGSMLVSCSASDSVLRIDGKTRTVTQVMRLPELLYGFNYGLKRSDSVVDHYITNDLQLTHVNCAWPWRDGVLVSSLIQGAIGWFDRRGRYREITRGFVGCHGARVRSDTGDLYFSDSCSGMIVFADETGTIRSRVGTGSRWLHDAVQLTGDVFAAAPFDRNEVLIMNVATRTILHRISCGSWGGPQFLAYDYARPNGRPGRSLIARMFERNRAPARSMQPVHRPKTARAIAAVQEKYSEEISRRDAAIAELETKYASELAARDQALVDHDQKWAAEVASRDVLLAELQSESNLEVARRDQLLVDAAVERNEAVRIRDEIIAGQEATISELRRRLGELSPQVEED